MSLFLSTQSTRQLTKSMTAQVNHVVLSSLSHCSRRSKNLLNVSKITVLSKASYNTIFINSRCFKWITKPIRFKNDIPSLSRPPTGTSRISIRNFRTKSKIGEGEKQTQFMKQPASQSQSLYKHFLFTVGICGSSFLVAFIYNYEKWQDIIKKLNNGTFKHEDYIGKKIDKVKFEEMKQEGFMRHLEGRWMQLTNGQKLILGIMAVNLSVFGLWRIPRLHPMMMKNFSSSLNHPIQSMLMSAFSHVSFTHLFVNMYVLWSFAPVAANLYGVEQFSAVYLSAGTIASLTSIVMLKLLKRPASVSVGASGAIMAILGIVCVTFPKAKLSIALVDQIFPHSFSADTGMKAIIAFDVLGLVLGWRLFDHAGHLGGLMFGILYAKYGRELIWGTTREKVLAQWDIIRKK